MCIALVSTQHPQYPLIILNNRDEFLHRPTQRAAWWDTPDTCHIFSGRDLARPERGTWLGITKQGRIAVLTNFREDSAAAAVGTRSRGAMVNSYLMTQSESVKSTKEWVHNALTAEGDDGVKGIGGFSLICGTIRPKEPIREGQHVELEPLAVMCNRSDSTNEASWICDTANQVHALSNGLFEDKHPWPKVCLGKDLLTQAIRKAAKNSLSEDELLDELFAVLSNDTLPLPQGEQTYETDLEALTHSIFIPAFIVHPEKKKTDNTNAEEVPTEAVETNDSQVPSVPKGVIPPSESQKLTVNTTNTGNSKIASICATPTSPSFRHRHPQLPLPNDSPLFYGTQKQTVILVDNNGRVKYTERTLYDEQAMWVGGVENKKERDTVCEFTIEGWQ